jgi:glucose-1-phosphate cytidylyltransferase
MKVVLFCGGQGLRIRDYSDAVPKPMVPVGYRPILWHLMKYYAHYGHKDFILCLGHKADVVKSYFLNYDETVSNDFTMTKGREVKLAASDIDSWNITFVDTGFESNIGQRLLRVKEHLKGEKEFLANYSDNVTDLPLDTFLNHFHTQDKVASFVTVQPPQSFHVIHSDDTGRVTNISAATESDIWINGGFFAFKHDIFNYINEGDELVLEPFNRLMRENQLLAYRYKGFWAAMDTFKEKQRLDDLYMRNKAPWQVWNGNGKHV